MAERLASLLGKKPLAQSQTASSFTVAICGPWGEGKTSLKNLTLRYLQNYLPQPHIVHFNPRQWNNEAAIIGDFFSQLANAVDDDVNQEAKAGAKTLISISELLLQGQIIYNLLITSLATNLVVADTANEAKALGIGASVLGVLAPLFKKKGEAVQKGVDEQKALSLTRLQAKAAEQLLSLQKPVVVFVDDLDRLTGPEIALVFQLLKFNADFPNVVYVLLADRVILERGLDTLYPGEGRRYLEKFVQLSLDLPQPPADALAQSFNQALSPLFKELNSVAPNLPPQIRAAYKDVFAPYLTTMRRVQLYVNAIHFTLPLGRDARNNIWEVHAFDVLLLELLRAHEPAVYREIHQNRGWLTSIFAPIRAAQLLFGMEKDNIASNTKLGEEEKDKRIAQLFERHKPTELLSLEKLLAVADNRTATLQILKLLFPNLRLLFQQQSETKKIIVDNGSSGFSGAHWDVERRLCSPRRFDRYFSAVVSQTILRQDERDLLNSKRGQQDELLTQIRELSLNNRTDDVLTELENIAERSLKPLEVEAFVTALMDWGDEMPLPSWSPSYLAPRIVRVCGIVISSLGRTPDLQEATSVFERACASTTGFSIPLACATNNLSIGDKSVGSYFAAKLRQISPEQNQQLNTQLMAQIKQAKEGLWKRFDEMIAGLPAGVTPLEKRSVAAPLLWQWIFRDAPQPHDPLDASPPVAAPTTWPSRDAARVWVAGLINAPQGFAQFAQMAAESAQSIWGDEAHYPNVMQLFRTDVIEQTTSEEDLQRVGEALDFTDLGERDRKWANTLLDAVRAKLTGGREMLPYFLMGDSTVA